MANNTRKLDPVQLSHLETIDDPSAFWIFGSKEEADGSLRSGKYQFDKLADYARRLQLERRISLTMETQQTEMLIGEDMTIYKIDTLNVSTITIGDIKVSKPDGKILNINIKKGSLVKFVVESLTSDATVYLFIHAKAKLEEEE